MLKKYADKVSEIEKEEIGVTLETALESPRTGGDNTKPSVRKNETILGNLITDGMLAKAKDIQKIKMSLWHSKMVGEFVLRLMPVQSQ